jgi:hypothetical protein
VLWTRAEAEPQVGHAAVVNAGRATISNPAASISTRSTTSPQGASDRSRLMIDILHQNVAHPRLELHQH